MINIKNFTSYKDLNVTLEGQGLTLITGENGSGKSTLCDALPWILFGKTSKAVSTTDVVSWGSKEPTQGTVTIEDLTIYRTRGFKPKDNDLYFTINGSTPTRGKDITDTQKLIDMHLGYNYQGFILSCYIHEFSIANTFFSATPKQRKDILDQLVDVTELENIKKALELDKKTTNKLKDEATAKYSKKEYELSYLLDAKTKAGTYQATADAEKKRLKAKIKAKDADFNNEIKTIQAAIKDLQGENCKACGAPANATNLIILKDLLNQTRTNKTEVEHFKNILKRYDSAPPTFNEADLVKAEASIQVARTEVNSLSTEFDDLETLQDCIKSCRGQLTVAAIQNLEEGTNALLAEFFDAELSVSLLIDTIEDKVEAVIKNSAYDCSFEQLSKGQRQILKFCFSLTAARLVQRAKGIKPTALYLDEVMDGLSENTKDKSFRLLRSLESEYSSIFVVEHSLELKAKFDNVWTVTNTNGQSELDEKS